jgi:hypothetical protein
VSSQRSMIQRGGFAQALTLDLQFVPKFVNCSSDISDFRISESFLCQRDTNKARSTQVSYLSGSKFRKQ